MAEAHKPALDPCGLLTDAEAEAVLGPIAGRFEGVDPILGVIEDQRVCVVSVLRDPREGANVGFADYEVVRKLDSLRSRHADELVDVEDVGEEAVWLEDSRVLLVLDGTELISVQMRYIQRKGLAAMKQEAVELAAIALDRLPEATGRG